MRRWEPCGGKFETGDVVRWTEGVWHNPRRRKKKSLRVGTRAVTAQVTDCDAKGWVVLEVMKCETGTSRYAVTLEPLKRKAVIKRKRTTIARGRAEKLAEAPQPKAKSRFLL